MNFSRADESVPRRTPDAERRAVNDRARVKPLPADARTYVTRTLRDPYHPWLPLPDQARWQRRAEQVRTQILVATGLWPLPKRTPLNPVIHGKIDKGDYTIEKVFFQSVPGHYVCGNLYRPTGKTGKLPAVLSPHGHWRDGRFYDAGEKTAADQVKQGAEQYEQSARYPLQARMVGLARMGCVVFHYDMVGYADSTVIQHRQGFTDAEAELRLQNAMGLQTWNSIRALDFITSLPDVDATRIGVTGASGGGTQTFILCAIDDRPAVAFPAVMVSTGMQGGCVCENCSLLRVGTGNIEFAAMFAPKPYGMSGADDWTVRIESRGLPELKQHYGLFGKSEHVMAKAFVQFKHNYNQVSRELMYDWMNRHLELGSNTVSERPFEPVLPEDLSVFDDEHPLPKDAKSTAQLRDYFTNVQERQYASLWPSDAPSYAKYNQIVGTAVRAMITDELPTTDDVIVEHVGRGGGEDFRVDRLLLGRKQAELLFVKESIPTAVYIPQSGTDHVVVWVHEDGHAGIVDAATGAPNAHLRRLLDAGVAVLSPDVFLTGEFHPLGGVTLPPPVNETYAGYTFGYNRTVLANRVHDVLTAITCARGRYAAKRVDLIGLGEAGVWVALAKAAAGGAVQRTAADLDDFSFEDVKSTSDVRMLPGGLKYGDLPGLVTLCAPDDLYLQGAGDGPKSAAGKIAMAYLAAGSPGSLTIAKPNEKGVKPAIGWLLRSLGTRMSAILPPP